DGAGRDGVKDYGEVLKLVGSDMRASRRIGRHTVIREIDPQALVSVDAVGQDNVMNGRKIGGIETDRDTCFAVEGNYIARSRRTSDGVVLRPEGHEYAVAEVWQWCVGGAYVRADQVSVEDVEAGVVDDSHAVAKVAGNKV